MVDEQTNSKSRQIAIYMIGGKVVYDAQKQNMF